MDILDLLVSRLYLTYYGFRKRTDVKFKQQRNSEQKEDKWNRWRVSKENVTPTC